MYVYRAKACNSCVFSFSCALLPFSFIEGRAKGEIHLFTNDRGKGPGPCCKRTHNLISDFCISCSLSPFLSVFVFISVSLLRALPKKNSKPEILFKTLWCLLYNNYNFLSIYTAYAYIPYIEFSFCWLVCIYMMFWLYSFTIFFSGLVCRLCLTSSSIPEAHQPSTNVYIYLCVCVCIYTYKLAASVRTHTHTHIYDCTAVCAFISFLKFCFVHKRKRERERPGTPRLHSPHIRVV